MEKGVSPFVEIVYFCIKDRRTVVMVQFKSFRTKHKGTAMLNTKRVNLALATALAAASLFASRSAAASPLRSGRSADLAPAREDISKGKGYMPPEMLKYPYISTYYVKPTVKVGSPVKIAFFVTDFESSKIRFLDDSHRFSVYLEYRFKGGASKTLVLRDVKSGDSAFSLEGLKPGSYEMRIWAVDAKGRESHRVIHDFRVVTPAFLAIPESKVYTMAEEDLAAYGIRNDGDLERIVLVGADGKQEVLKEKRAGVPGYTVTVPRDPETGGVPVDAYKKAKIVYDEGYNKVAVERTSVENATGLQKLINDKVVLGFRKIVLLPGTYRISSTKSLLVPSNTTLDLGTATLKQNSFTGAKSCVVRIAGAVDAHLVGGTIEGDYWTHNYAGSPNGSEWVSGFEIGGDSTYCTVDGVKVVDIAGCGGQNGMGTDARGGPHFFLESLPAFAPGGLDPKTGKVDASDKFRFTTDFKGLSKAVAGKGRRRLQISKYLGRQGVGTRSWQMTVAWYDASQRFISAETAWQYREMWIPPNAAFLRVSVEAESAHAARAAGLKLTSFAYPVNCSVVRCTFDHCRCVGYAASAMKNMLFAGNTFTRSGECATKCAFDAEEGCDQMQDVYFLKNVFRDNPVNNSIHASAGHNFVMEKNEGDIYLSGRAHSPCVRNSVVGSGTYHCDTRLRSGYGRFDGNDYTKGVHLGANDMKTRSDGWDYVLSGLSYDGGSFEIDVGAAGRVVNCTFRNMTVRIANACDCMIENCTDGSSYLPFPSGRWLRTAVKDSKFSRFYGSNAWDGCRFSNTTFEKFSNANVVAGGCVFAGCRFGGVGSSSFDMSDCTFDRTSFGGGFWELPANFAFKNCSVTTSDDASFVTLGLYSIGNIGFDGCSFAGKRSALEVSDLRPYKGSQGMNPDEQPGLISARGVKWKGEAKSVIDRPQGAVASTKKLTICATGNVLPEGVTMVADLPACWKLK